MNEDVEESGLFEGSECSHDSFRRHIDESLLEQALTPVRACPRPSLWPLMEHRIKERENTDLQVRIGTSMIPCHLLPLQCFSGYFEQEVRPGQGVVELPEQWVRPAAFRILYEWIIEAGRPLDSGRHFVAVLSAAEFLQVPDLVEHCWLHLDNPRVVENVAFYVFLQAHRFGHGELKAIMLRRISRYFLALVSTPEFCELELDDVGLLLSSNSIAVFDETDVLYAACQWLLYDWTTRRKLVESVMQLVRFKSMSAGDLARLCVYRECEELQPILRHSATKELVDKALAFICARPRSQQAGADDRPPVNRIRLVPDSPETLAYLAGDASYDGFKEFLEVVQGNPNIWRTFRVAENNNTMLPDGSVEEN